MPQAKKDRSADSTPAPSAPKVSRYCAHCHKRHPGWYYCEDQKIIDRKLYSREWELRERELEDLVEAYLKRRGRS